MKIVLEIYQEMEIQYYFINKKNWPIQEIRLALRT